MLNFNVRKLAIFAGMAGMIAVGGCSGMNSTQQSTLSGAGIGAAGGALLGGVTGGDPVTGAVIGGAAGAGAGYLYDRNKRDN